MKKLTFTLFLLLTVLCLNATKNDFRVLQSLTLPFSPSVFSYEHTGDFGYFLCSTKTDMVMIDGNSGKILWQINFQKNFSVKKLTNQFWNKKANVILVYDEDLKNNIAVKYFLDGKTGNLLWKSDKYVSDFGKYKLSEGFSNFFDEKTNGVLLPTKETVEFVNVQTGSAIWSKSFSLTGKAREFDCYLMENYDLVKIITGKDVETYLTTHEGTEVSDIESYYDKKKAMTTTARTTVLNIPEKNCYVIMRGKESAFMDILGTLVGGGTGFQSWKMKFMAYENVTDRLLWEKEYTIAQSFDWINNSPYLRMIYSDGKIYVEHEPNLKTNSGLTVLDVNTGDVLWECYYTTSEMKGLLSVVLTPFPSPDPVFLDGKAYVVDKIKNKVVCYNADNGAKIWESEKFPDAQKIPTLIAVDGKIVMGMGALAQKILKTETETQFCFGYTTNRMKVVCSGKKQYTYKYIYDNDDKYGLIAYNAETGKIDWESATIAKAAKDKFSYIASTQYIDGKLYCATNKNLFVIEPKSGKILTSSPVSKEKMGDIWGMTYFEKQKQIVLNCNTGIVKIDALTGSILGALKTPNICGFYASELMNANDSYDDYAIFTSGNMKKMEYKEFSSVDLENMTIRGTHTTDVMFENNPHFAIGGEKFFFAKGNKLILYSVK